jgi:CubicO group peptidase (beta-lactamase class C family)
MKMNIKSTLVIFSVLVILFIGFLMTEKEVQAREFPVQEIAIPQKEIDPEELENFLDEFVPENMERSHVPRLVIVVVQGDEILLSKGYGYADLENEIPMTTQTALRAGSVSKSLTATAVIQLVEQGILDLDAPVSDYVTDLDLEDEFGSVSTVNQLLNHTGGYADTLVLSHSLDYEHWEPLGDVLSADLPQRAFPPGLVSSYSDWNFSLLGYAIEKVTGTSYEEAIADLLFKPLGMESSTYTQPLPEETYKNLAVGYGWNYEKASYEIVPHDFVRMSPGVVLVTNGEDMGAYMRALLNGGSLNGNRILGDEALALLLERQSAAHPYSRGNTYAFTELTVADRKVLYKDGNGIGFSSRVILMPDQDLGIFVSTNHRNLGEGMWVTEAAVMATRTLTTEILERFVPASKIEIPEVQPLPDRANHIKRFTGHYQKAGISRSDFFKLEGLLDNVDVKNNGDGTVRIGSGTYIEVEPLVFQNVEYPTSFVVFIENQNGEVEFLTYGGTGSYQKVPWYQSKNVQIVLLAAVLLISLSILIVWPLKRNGPWLAWVVSLLNLGFIAGVGLLFVPSVTDLLIFFKTIPVSVKILFAFPWLIGLLSLSLPVFLARMWKDGNVTWWTKTHYILALFSAVLTVWLASFWNLML